MDNSIQQQGWVVGGCWRWHKRRYCKNNLEILRHYNPELQSIIEIDASDRVINDSF